MYDVRCMVLPGRVSHLVQADCLPPFPTRCSLHFQFFFFLLLLDNMSASHNALVKPGAVLLSGL